jgi:transposase
MSKRIFTRKQIEELLKNKSIAKCSEKSITFSKDFKIRAVTLYEEHGLTPQEIFRDAGLDLNMIGRKMPKNCMKRWNKSYRAKGRDGLLETRGKAKGGGRPKTKYLNDGEKIKYLEAQVAYLKAENDFLAKLRAARAE